MHLLIPHCHRLSSAAIGSLDPTCSLLTPGRLPVSDAADMSGERTHLAGLGFQHFLPYLGVVDGGLDCFVEFSYNSSYNNSRQSRH